MGILQRFLLKQILSATALVSAAFLLLFAFFDLIDELGAVKGDYGLPQALSYVLALAPSHLYDLMPISILIACVLVLSRLALSSEFTIMRTSGLGPASALATLLGIGLIFTAVTWVLGDYAAPASTHWAENIKGELGNRGAWLRDKQEEGQYFVHIEGVRERGQVLDGVLIIGLSPQGRILSRIQAPQAQLTEAGWLLQNASSQHYPSEHGQAMQVQHHAQQLWPSRINADMVQTAMLKPSRMSTLDLYRYSQHLQHNEQNAQQYDIALWRKLLYPLSCLVMVMLALPFAYLHHRNGSAAGYVFMGVMIGIGFYLFNNVSNHIGSLRDWPAWFAAALPAMVFASVGLGLFTWLVMRR